MERKLVIVHETSDVNELAIENVSQSEEVLVQAGDIVKGGQQDRVLAVDLIVPARSGKIPIAAFCVESGRWEQRGEERSAQFSTSNDMVTTKELKLAAKQSKSQSKVWAEVDAAQGMMSRSVGREVRANLSQSSLQLAIENEKVQESSAPYLKKLSSIVDGKSDVIGFALAINNKLNSADIYATSVQFKTFWPKLLRTAAIEAVAQRLLSETGEPVSNATVDAFFVDGGRGDESINDVTKRTRMMKRESDQSLFFETRDMDRGGAWIHRNYLTK
jgi:hypothetical protein